MLDELPPPRPSSSLVTHNKGSMAACQGLYGITMETKGVSRHVAVEFGEVEQFVPEATGDERAASESRAETRSRESAPEPGGPGEPGPRAAAVGEESEPVLDPEPAQP